MDLFDVILLAFALAMDCFAVSVTTGLMTSKYRFGNVLVMALYFGGFQGLMPVFGWFAGTGFALVASAFDHWIAFGLLAVIGINMIRESLSESESEGADITNHKTLFGLAVATSIDALVVGVNFGLTGTPLVVPALIIAAVSFAMTVCGFYLGNRFKRACKFNFELVGGVVLILIGLKILIEHLFFQ
ncbi:MAG: manganese efflux pump [Salinivirgaceae bacterium]|nr:manganese efflux pump [Salinivirgaceae bacterium]